MRIKDDILKTLAPKFKKGDAIIYTDGLWSHDPGVVISNEPIYNDISGCFVYVIKIRDSITMYANEQFMKLLTSNVSAEVIVIDFGFGVLTDRGSRGVQFDYSDTHLCSFDADCPDGCVCVDGICRPISTPQF